MLSIRSLASFSLQLGIELSLLIEPPSIEDVCYAIFSEFNKVATVSVSKPSCVRAIVYGSNFELRFFARQSSCEALVTIYSYCEDASRSRQSISKLLTVFRDFSRACRRYIASFMDTRVYVKVVATLRKEDAVRTIRTLVEDFGASLRAVEFRDLDDSSIKVFTGLLPIPNTKLGEVSVRVVMVERKSSYTTMSVTLESSAKGDDFVDIESKIYGLVGLARAFMDVSMLRPL